MRKLIPMQNFQKKVREIIQCPIWKLRNWKKKIKKIECCSYVSWTEKKLHSLEIIHICSWNGNHKYVYFGSILQIFLVLFLFFIFLIGSMKCVVLLPFKVDIGLLLFENLLHRNALMRRTHLYRHYEQSNTSSNVEKQVVIFSITTCEWTSLHD